MTVLEYAQVPPRKPFRDAIFWGSFVPLLILLTASGIERAFGSEPYLPNPAWVNTTRRIAEGAAGMGFVFYTLPAAVFCAATIPFRRRSMGHLVYVWIGIVIALAATVALPSMRPARSSHHPFLYVARQARAISTTSYWYATDHAGNYPPHLGDLVFAGHIHEKELVDDDMRPHAWKPPNPIPPEATWPSYAKDVEAGSIFIYVGADLTTAIPQDPEIIVVYTKPGRRVLPGHRVLGFMDGNARLVEERELASYFAKSNAARARHGLPPMHP